MRVGILGGSFDPPHVGHVLMAIDCLERLSLDRLLVIPAAQQPLKPHGQTAPAHRMAMARAAFAGIPGIEVDPIEAERGGLSFTVDTVETVCRRFPGAHLCLLMGEDVVPTLPRWREPERLLSLVQLVVIARQSGAAETGLPDGGLAPAIHLTTRRVDLSSTEIRARVSAGQSVRGFLPEAVADYIAATGLYREHTRALDPATSRA